MTDLLTQKNIFVYIEFSFCSLSMQTCLCHDKQTNIMNYHKVYEMFPWL